MSCKPQVKEDVTAWKFSHYFIVIAVNLITVAFRFFENPAANREFTTGLMIAALILFYSSIFSDHIYYYDRYQFAKKETVMSCLFLLTGALVMLAFRSAIYGILIGALVVTGGNTAAMVEAHKIGTESAGASLTDPADILENSTGGNRH